MASHVVLMISELLSKSLLLSLGSLEFDAEQLRQVYEMNQQEVSKYDELEQKIGNSGKLQNGTETFVCNS